MILIADSGSTKTDWVLLKKGKPTELLQTDGYNPYYYGVEKIELIVGDQLIRQIEDANAVKAIYFYGSGCSSPENIEKVSSPLRRFFPLAHVKVFHDLLGAAHALLGKNEGIACILGTGSNTCLFDGSKIIEQVPSLGYLYGDEGSGTYLGCAFIRAYLAELMPKELVKQFEREYNLDQLKVLKESYNNPNPNKFMAKFPHFIKDHIDHPYMREMVKSNFSDFYNHQIARYESCHILPISFVGSIAYHFHDLLNETALEYNFVIGKIIQKPIHGLIDFYSEMFSSATEVR
ncbi:MAG: ATPase [Bacteroidales bacterium]